MVIKKDVLKGEVAQMNKNRELQLRIIEKNKIKIKRWAKTNGIHLHNIETITPFIDADFELHVVLFFNTDIDLNTYNKDGTSNRLQQLYLEELTNNNYPEEWLKAVTFEFDSYENVMRKYNGNYFYRMR